MERTEELWGICRVIKSDFQRETVANSATSRFLVIAQQTNANIRHLSALLDSIEKLYIVVGTFNVVILHRSARKEYSNDPSAEIADLTKSFQSKIVLINRDLSTISDLHKSNQYRVSSSM